MILGGYKIIVTATALEKSDVRLFPESKNRSARILKKLIKRFGGEFRKQPCMWKVRDTLFVHPSIYPQLQHALAKVTT